MCVCVCMCGVCVCVCVWRQSKQNICFLAYKSIWGVIVDISGYRVIKELFTFIDICGDREIIRFVSLHLYLCLESNNEPLSPCIDIHGGVTVIINNFFLV